MIALALLEWLKWIAGCASLFLLGSALLLDDRGMILTGAGLAAISLMALATQFVASRSAGCPLCMGKILGFTRCSLHHRARRLAGSVRLRVASDILVRGNMICPFCNERVSTRSSPRNRVRKRNQSRT